jgi:hypothetical protein
MYLRKFSFLGGWKAQFTIKIVILRNLEATFLKTKMFRERSTMIPLSEDGARNMSIENHIARVAV